MRGYVENSIVILGDAESIFKLTNNIERWPDLFSEYKKVKIIENRGNEILFELETVNGKKWQSKRTVDCVSMSAKAERVNLKTPFVDMQIRWEYEKLPKNIGVIMTWIQEFIVEPNCGHDTYDMESYLNKSSQKQMKVVKHNVESVLNGNI
jgi:aromatase